MDYIKFLPVGNGDSILIRAGNKTVMTDVHYRSSEEHYDIKPEIKEACPSNHLHYFIVTHTDKDHVRGFDEIFHRGKPDKDWNGKILVDEIICTQYVLDLKNPSQEAKNLVNEIRRRNNLVGEDCKRDGNRLRVVKANDKIIVNSRLKGHVLSPSQNELDAAFPKEDQDKFINNTSIITQWVYQDGSDSAVTKMMLGGDAEREVWERLNSDEPKERLEWHISTAHHHCSLTPFAKKDENEEYQDNADAFDAINHPIGRNAFVVSSSRKITRSKPNPPHYKAKNKWLKIIDKEDNFFCTATHDNDEPNSVVFELSSKGLKKSTKNTVSKPIAESAGLNRTTKYGVE
ncbi:hypothetical protein [Vibrio tritonius]|uniref:hypothetical protein n=1 Tax=Vibrio tritonius TaxID=1435069 RepID=UPI00315D2AC7